MTHAEAVVIAEAIAKLPNVVAEVYSNLVDHAKTIAFRQYIGKNDE